MEDQNERLERVEKVQEKFGQQMDNMMKMFEKMLERQEAIAQMALPGLDQVGGLGAQKDQASGQDQAGGSGIQKDQAPFVHPIAVQKEDNLPLTTQVTHFPVDTSSDDSAIQKITSLEKRLCSIEGLDAFGNVDVTELSLVTGLVVPPKFKQPEFKKFFGNKCPRTHLTMYIRKMAAYADNEALMILTGTALTWYTLLDRTKVKSWKDLANTFMSQYNHVTEMAPDRFSLMAMEKKDKESFREYAQRWRDVAAQIQPPLDPKETTKMFIHTLKAPYYNMLIGQASKDFSQMVMSGDMIDGAIKEGRLKVESSTSKGISAQKKKEGEASMITHATSSYRGRPSSPYYSAPIPQSYQSFSPYTILPQNTPTFYPAQTQPSYHTNPYSPYTLPASSSQVIATTNIHPRPNAPTYRNQRPQFDPIPMTYTELYPQLLTAKLITPVKKEPLKPPFPYWYNPNVQCEYHEGQVGYSLEDCYRLKYQVQGLMRRGEINLQPKGEPVVNRNLMPVNQTEDAN